MTLDQALSFALIGTTIVLFVSGRLPYDLVALLSLLAGIVIGLIPIEHAFDGFSEDIVIIIATALLVSAAVAKSGVIETIMRPIVPYLTTESRQVPVLVGAVMFMSIFTKNIGALAIFIPVVFQLARRTGTSPSAVLMPMAFASLIGGVITMIGTSPNIVVSKVRQDIVGEPFRMFDYTPVGLGLAIAGLIFLSFGYRLLPKGQKPVSSMDAAFQLEDYTTEARLPAESPMVDKSLAELEAAGDGQVTVATIIRERFRRLVPTPSSILRADDVLLLEGEPEDLERLVSRAKLELAGERHAADDEEQGETMVVEGVITGDSPLVNATPSQFALHDRHGLSVLAVSRSGQRIASRLSALRFRVGDVAVLKGRTTTIADSLGELRILPLAERAIALGSNHRSWIPIGVLGGAMLLVAFGIVPVALAFFSAGVLLLALRSLKMDEAYEAVDWGVLILVGALIPVSDTIRTTGGTELIADWLSGVVELLPPMGSLALMIVAGMAITPFLNNAATVLVVAPIGASLALKLGLKPDAFPDGRGDRGGLRLPHADRAPVQYAGHGARRLSLR